MGAAINKAAAAGGGVTPGATGEAIAAQAIVQSTLIAWPLVGPGMG